MGDYAYLGEFGGSNHFCSAQVFFEKSQGQGPGLLGSRDVIGGPVVAVEAMVGLGKLNVHEFLSCRPQDFR